MSSLNCATVKHGCCQDHRAIAFTEIYLMNSAAHLTEALEDCLELMRPSRVRRCHGRNEAYTAPALG